MKATKKIGILTFHKAYNYGASLQCFSLFNKLSSIYEDADIEIIDFCSQTMIDEYQKKIFLKTKSPIIWAKYILKSIINLTNSTKKRLFLKARNCSIEEIQKDFILSHKSLVSNSIEEFEQFIKELNYDIVIVGSDAIWNDNQSFSPNPYLLVSLYCQNSISFAASSYGFRYRDLDEDLKHNYKTSLQKFNKIFVRDEETKKYLEWLSINRKICHVCDPSLLLNFDIYLNDDLLKSVKNKMLLAGLDLNKPMIGVMADDWLAKKVYHQFHKKYQIVCIYNWNNYSDFYIPNLTSKEWSIVFRFFRATFTHYFHGTIFSLKNGTLTFSVEKDSNYSRHYITKTKDILSRMNLNECYYNYSENMWEEIENKLEWDDKQLSAYKTRVEKALLSESKTFDNFKKAIDEVIK